MPDNNDNLPVPQPEWLRFVDSVRTLLGSQADDPPLDQFLQFRDAVLAMVAHPEFLKGLQESWPVATANQTDIQRQEHIRGLLLMELRAFPVAVEVAQARKSDEEHKSRLRKLLGRASTVTGSVKDIIENLPPHVKMGLIAFKQLLDIFKS